MSAHPPDHKPGHWTEGPLPPGVRLGINSVISGPLAFKRYFSTLDPALAVGAHCTLDNVHFAIGPAGRITIGDYCYLCSTVLLADLEVAIGNYVTIGWNATITDADFHPVAPAERIADAIACSPLGKGRPRPPIARERVVIEDDAWIGPNSTILKGVRIGSGAWVEPGALVTRDVPAGCRVSGNPAQIIGTVSCEAELK